MNLITHNRFCNMVRSTIQNRKKNDMRPLSKDKEDSIVNGLSKYYNVLQVGREDDLLLIDIMRALSNLGTTQHEFVASYARPTFVLSDCAEAYAYVMYFIPKMLKLDRDDFMYRVNEEAICLCADYNESKNIREANSMNVFSVSVLENILCNAKMSGQYKLSEVVFNCARCISLVSIILDMRNIDDETFDAAVEVVLMFKDGDASKLGNALKNTEMPKPEYRQMFRVFPEGGKIYDGNK